MNRTDAYVLGLLALACWYLDSRAAAAPRPHAAAEPRFIPFPGGLAGLAFTSHCPRRAGHPVSRRSDGAIWCRGCDEAFFPHAPEWEEALAGLAV